MVSWHWGGVLNEFDMEQNLAALLDALERINFQRSYYACRK